MTRLPRGREGGLSLVNKLQTSDLITTRSCSDQPLPINSKICIVGAGISGLYIALILQSLNLPNLSIDILEADHRVGGRVYTHRFSDEPYDYYDVGAMRFPRLPPMDRVFDLFHRVQVPLEPYRMNGPNCRLLRNGRVIVGQGLSDLLDPHGVGRCSGGSVPDEIVPQVDAILRQAFEPFKNALQRDLVTGFRRLMEVDDLTAREYLRRGQDGGGPKFDFATIQWMETSSTATGHFDQALTECVLDSFAFDSSPGQVEWMQVTGGTSRVVERMCQLLGDQEDRCHLEVRKRVVRIAMDNSHDSDDNLSVQCAGEAEARSGYLTVFNTTPLGCLQRIETTSLHLHPMQKEAIRCLRSENSTKVALKFSYPWWLVDCGISHGGCSSSDLPSRVCIYPSSAPADKPAVLLASYTWGQDASRMGALVQPTGGDQRKGEEELVECVLRDLAILHQPHVSYEKLRAAYMDHHAFCWGNSPFASGAFALFGAGQFSQLYPYLSHPAADGKFHIVGEASSIHHGWVVGALNSAYIAVYRFLVRFNQWQAIQVLERDWGTVDEMKLAEGTSSQASTVKARL